MYLPHLDYGLQKYGPDDSRIAGELAAIDTVCGELIDHFQARGASIVILSEYGIRSVSHAVHLNRLLRERGLLAVRDEMGHELLDAGVSRAFAVADHQVAHVYVNDPDCLHEVRTLLEQAAGVAAVLDTDGKRANGLDHERSGELVAVAEPDAWFTYYYWQDDERAPDYARTVEIHRKPGYDPVELFLDPCHLTAKAAHRCHAPQTQDRLPNAPGCHSAGCVPGAWLAWPRHHRPAGVPVLMTNRPTLLDRDSIAATDVFGILMSHLQGVRETSSRNVAWARPRADPNPSLITGTGTSPRATFLHK